MKTFLRFVLLASAALAQAQAPPLSGTVTGLNQCLYVQGQPYLQLAIQVSGSFAGTLVPFVQATYGGQRQPWTVTPAGSTTPQTEIIAAGNYNTALATPYLFSLCFDYWISGAANLAVSATNGGGSAGISLPIQISPTPATSQSHECASVISNGSGGTVTAVPVLQSTDASGVGHDVMCVVATSTRAGDVGGIVFPYINSSSPNASASQHQAGNWEISGTVSRLTMTNTSASTRRNAFQWRSCPLAGCGTDWSWIEDNANAGNEDMTWLAGTNNAALYVTGNCPAPGCATTFQPAGGPQFLINGEAGTATTNPDFGIVDGHIAHGTNPIQATDTWATATCASNTVTVTFSQAFANATYQVLLTDQTTAGGARVSTKNAGSMVITCTGATDTVDYLVLGHPY